MIVALPEQPRLLAGNLVELDQHALDGDIAAIPLAGKDNGAIAPRAKLLCLVDLEAPHLQDGTRDLVGRPRHSDNVRLKLGLTNKSLGLVDDLFHSLLRRIVIAGLGILALVLVGAFPVLDATTTSPVPLLLLRLGTCGGVGSFGCR